MDRGPIDVLVDQRGDIYIDAADTTAAQVWLNPVKAQRWVLPQLKAQGISVRPRSPERCPKDLCCIGVGCF
jgi:hypothetical protein